MEVVPASFHIMIYFVMVTLSLVGIIFDLNNYWSGYGDIYPYSEGGRISVMILITIGIIFY
jgi:hypothetical protein